MTEKVANSMTVPTHAHVPFLRSGVDALPGRLGRGMWHFARADMLAMRHVLKVAAP